MGQNSENIRLDFANLEGGVGGGVGSDSSVVGE